MKDFLPIYLARSLARSLSPIRHFYRCKWPENWQKNHGIVHVSGMIHSVIWYICRSHYTVVANLTANLGFDKQKIWWTTNNKKRNDFIFAAKNNTSKQASKLYCMWCWRWTRFKKIPLGVFKPPTTTNEINEAQKRNFTCAVNWISSDEIQLPMV